MTDIIQCPQCGTHFKITPEQSKTHQGKVRCGQCHHVFSAADHRSSAPQQLDLPLMLEDIEDATGLFETYDPHSSNLNAVSISPQAAARKANNFSHIPDVHVTQEDQPASKRHTRLWLFGSTIVGFVLLLQIIYFLRADIAARLPGLKPTMLQICAKLKCNLPLPQKVDLINIESSDLESDPAQASIITLHATLRSSAPYAMTYPNIELTLTDLQDNALARRTFKPTEYLSPAEDEKLGLPANRDSNIKLHLNTTDLKAAGYRLFLYYQL